jgi:rubrerythrin
MSLLQLERPLSHDVAWCSRCSTSFGFAEIGEAPVACPICGRRQLFPIVLLDTIHGRCRRCKMTFGGDQCPGCGAASHIVSS